MYILDRMILLLMVLDCHSLDYKIAEFIVYNKQIACQCTIRELASQIYVSPATVLRFVKKLGIDDYKLFREFLYQDVKNEKYELESHKPLDQLSIDSLKKALNIDVLNDMIDKIKRCKKLMIHCPIEFALLFKSVIQFLRTQERTVDILAFRNAKEKTELLKQLGDEDVILCLFPTHSYYSWVTTLHHLEESFVHAFEKLKCHKYFAGNSQNEVDDCKMIHILYTANNTHNKVITCLINDYMVDQFTKE